MNGDRRGGATPEDFSPLWVLGILGGAFVLLGVVWVGGTIGALLAGQGWAPPPFSLTTLILVLRGHDAWPGAPTGWVAGGIVAVATVTIVAVVIIAVQVDDRLRSDGLARQHQVKELTPKAVAKSARRLRRSLKTTRAIAPAETGLLLGDLAPSGPELRASWEDVALMFMGPRSGKTSAVAAPNIFGAPGACLVTSNRYDIYTTTARAREQVGTVWLFDPQAIAHGERRMWWDMLAMAATIEGADRLAMHLASGVEDGDQRDSFFPKAGRNTLKIVLHAAAIGDHGLPDVLAWLSDPGDRAPVDILRRHGLTTLAKNLQGTINGATETRDGIYEHARQAVAPLLDPEVLAWVSPPEDDSTARFDPQTFVSSRDTLFLLSKDGGGSAAGVTAAFTDACLRAGIAHAEASRGGRLDPPLLAVLDEAANICKIADLPALYSHLGARGVIPVTVLQSYRQGVGVWGRNGMDALWSAATTKLLGAGLDDANFAEDISKLLGEHYITETSVSRSRSGGRSVTTSRRRERVLDVSDVREIKKGTAILLASSTRAAWIHLKPWYRSDDASQISREQEAMELEITQRAEEEVSV